MRILILNQFYSPDSAPTGQVAHDLARSLVARGHEVTALASRRSYSGAAVYPAREVIDGVAVQRLATLAFGPKSHVRKLLAYASFYAATAIRLARLRPRPDVVVALTTPPYIGLLARLVGFWRGWRRVHWVMDLYPDAMEAHGMLGASAPGRLVASWLGWLTRREFAGAAAVLTLGPDMATRCARYLRSPDRLAWVPLWAETGLFTADHEAVRRLRSERGWDGKFVLLYSGNMGLGHRFGEFLALAAQSAESRLSAASAVCSPRFAFAGSGRRQAQIEAFIQAHPEAPVELLPYAASGDLATHLRSADVLLVSLEPAWVGCMLPSKLQGIFAAGRPVIFVGPRACSIARWIEEAGAGWVVEPGDAGGLRRCLEQALHPAERMRRGAAGRVYALAHFEQTRNCARIADLIEAAEGR